MLHHVGDIGLVDEVCSVRATALIQFRSRVVVHALTPFTEDALPRAPHERGVDHPGSLFARVLERDHLVEVLVSAGQTVDVTRFGSRVRVACGVVREGKRVGHAIRLGHHVRGAHGSRENIGLTFGNNVAVFLALS
jgi:hypothetical protein